MRNNKIRIVLLKPTDWLKYKSIRLEALMHDPQAFNSKLEVSLEYPDNYWKDKLNDKNEIHLFAQYNNEIVGTISASLTEKCEKNTTAVIHEVYVNASKREMGIGKLLVERLLEKIKKTSKIGLAKLWVKETQLPAIHIYKSVGFSFTERAGKNTIVMENQL